MQYHSSSKFHLARFDRGSFGSSVPRLTLPEKNDFGTSPKTVRNRRHKLRQELLLPVLEPQLKLPALPALVKANLGKYGRLNSALRIPTTRRSEEEDIVVYTELRQGHGLVFCPPSRSP